MSEKIGDLNGKWSVTLKIALATYPIVVGVLITWGVWVTSNIYHFQSFENIGPRFTAIDAELALSRMERVIDGKIAKLPPEDWRKRIERVEHNDDTTNTRLHQIDLKLERMLLVLDRLQDKMP